MTDIVERLRDELIGTGEDRILMCEAADVIEQLRADIEALNRALDLLEAKSRQD